MEFLKKKCHVKEECSENKAPQKIGGSNSTPLVDCYDKFLEISFSIALEKDVFDKTNNNNNEKTRQRLRQHSSLGVPTISKSHGLKRFSYSFRRYVFKRSYAFSKSSVHEVSTD